MPKTLYEEAIADVKKLRELAQSQARDEVLKKVEPRIKQLVEQQLFGEADEEEDDVDEANVTANVAGFTAPLGDDPKKDKRLKHEAADKIYESADEEALAKLSGFARPTTDDRFVAEAYRAREEAAKIATAPRKEKLSEAFQGRIASAISKLEDMYVYLRESYSGPDRDPLEAKLEESYRLVNAVKESTMKLRDLLSEDSQVVLKINGLPEDVDPDALSIDVITDEEAGGEEGAAPEAEPGAEAAPPAPAPEAPPPAAEADDEDEDSKEDMDENDVLEISESELKRELSRLREAAAKDFMADKEVSFKDAGEKDFADADDEGHPEVDKVSSLPGDAMGEADEEDVDEADDEDLDELQLRRKEDEYGMDAADNHKVEACGMEDEDDDAKMESARSRLKRASKRLSEARGTAREAFCRSMYRSAVKAYRSARSVTLAESKKKNVKAPVAKSAAQGTRLAEALARVEKLERKVSEVNLLNAKLIHANKLLRLEGITRAQKSAVIDRLDEARNLREVRLISESLTKALANGKGSMVESASRGPRGSASRPSRSGATSNNEVLAEGLDSARWAKLAGLK